MKFQMKHIAAAALLLSAGAAMAQAKAPEPDFTVSYNLGLTSEYRYRGVSQSSQKPAVQGGVDVAFKNGSYVGLWASSISWIKNASKPTVATGPIEIDLYGGYKGELSKDVSYDVGGLYYLYSGNTNTKNGGANANTFEIYGALSSGIYTAKLSQSTTNLFGTAAPGITSKGSQYFELSAAYDLGSGYTLTPHIGAQKIKNFTSYTDYSLTLAKDIDGLVLSVAYVGTNRAGKFGTEANTGKDLYKNGLVVAVKKNF